jgi:hypothetical protein
MRKMLVLITVLCFMGGIFVNSCVKKVPENIVWNHSLDQGLKLAEDQGKNLMVVFDKDG